MATGRPVPAARARRRGGAPWSGKWRPTTNAHPPRAEPPLDVERLIFFSDAVIAIAITLLVIELDVPAGLGTDASLRQALAELGPKFFSVFLSFAVIGLWWAGHHRLYRLVARFDAGLIPLNMLMLVGIAFLPFASKVLGEYSDLPTAVVLYAATNVLIAFSLVAMRRYVGRRDLLVEGVSPVDYRQRTWVTASTGLVFLASIPVAAWSATAAMLTWNLIWVVSLGATWRRRQRLEP